METWQRLLALGSLLTGWVLTAAAVETCGEDPASAINHTDNYILGELDAMGVAMHWPTGLIWQRCLVGHTWNTGQCDGNTASSGWRHWMNNYLPRAFEGQSNWGISAASDLDRISSGAWRMPYMNELGSITSGCANDPRINRNVFPRTPYQYYWSGSTYASSFIPAWRLAIADGSTSVAPHAEDGYAILVRGGQPFHALGEVLTTTGGAGSTVEFGPLSLQASSGAGTAWGGARISGDGTARLQVNGGAWVTEAVIKSGDTIRVRMTTGSAGSTRVANLALRSAHTTGTSANATNGGGEGSVLSESVTRFVALADNSQPDLAVTALLADAASADTVYSGIDGAGIFKSTNGGASWSAAHTQPGNTRVRALAQATPTTLYAATYGGGVFKSTDAGLNWFSCATQPSDLNLLSLVKAGNGRLYAGSETGVFVSDDACASWVASNSGLPD